MSGGKTVVELRVHGVSGTPPEAMLNCPTESLSQVAGDKDAGFYRRAAWIDDAASPPEAGKWRRLMEAYSWGGLTSRRASRALWLLLLPFSLINLAHWMLPPAHHRRSAAVVVSLLRLLALSFTMTLLLAMTVAVLDIAVWQCGGVEYCSAGRGPLAILSHAPAGVRLALGALPLVVVIVVLWLLGREETSTVAAKDLPPDAVVPAGAPSPLEDERFWNHDPSVQRMRACHVTAWTSGLAAVVLAAAVKYTHAGPTGTVNVVLLSANLAVLAIVVAATGWTQATGRGGKPPANWTEGLLMKLRWFALILLALSLVWVAVWGGIPARAPATFLPGLRSAIYALLITQVVLLVAVFVGTWLSIRGGGAEAERDERGYRPTLGGYTAPFVALLGWLLGGGLSVGMGAWTAQILGNLVFSTHESLRDMMIRKATLVAAPGDFSEKYFAMNSPAPLIVPPPYLWSSVATVLLILATVIGGFAAWYRSGRVRKADKPGAPAVESHIESAADPQVRDRIARVRARAALPDVGPTLIAVLSVVAVLFVGASVVLFELYPDLIPRRGYWVAIILGTPIVLVIVLVGLVIQAFRNRQVRRTVAILWDVVTFWPRANHPLTPPSYGGRTVFDLRIRMAELTSLAEESVSEAEDSTRVVLVSHSQGTIIAAATLMQATTPEERYPLLTFGSPLRRLYARNFPAYFGYDAISALRWFPCDPELRWINLWALTDPIGGWVFDDKDVHVVDGTRKVDMKEALADTDIRILDVQQQDPEHHEYAVDVTGPVCGHSGFWTRGEYVKAVDALQAIVAPDAEPDRVASVPPTVQAM